MGPKQVHGNMAGETVQSYIICNGATSSFRMVVLCLRSELRFAAPLRGHLASLPSPSTLLGLPLHIPLLVCPFSLFASLLLSDLLVSLSLSLSLAYPLFFWISLLFCPLASAAQAPSHRRLELGLVRFAPSKRRQARWMTSLRAEHHGWMVLMCACLRICTSSHAREWRHEMLSWGCQVLGLLCFLES